MGISLKKEYLKRYKDIAYLLLKYGNSDLVKNSGLEETISSVETDPNSKTEPQCKSKPDELADDLEKLGPTFIKLGQLLSTRPDFLPAPYLESLARLQDNCLPFSFAEVEKAVTEELGVRLSKLFSEFTVTPVAAASIGQIHHAVMRNGREVAVKIQRPGIREVVNQDLEVLGTIADFYDKHTETGKRLDFTSILEEFKRSILAELDYTKEARNLSLLKENLHHFTLLTVPAPVESYSTSKILTMDFIHGKKITSVGNLLHLEINGTPLVEQMFEGYLQQILIDGFFHADPHPGNIFLTDDNKLALIDLGMVARTTPHMQEKLLQLLLAIAEGRPDSAARVAIDIGEPRPNFDESAFRKQLATLIQGHLDNNINQMEIGTVILGLTKSAGDCGIKVPSELTLLGKTLLNLDQVGRTLDPSFNPNACIRQNAAKLMEQRMIKGISPMHMYTSVVESKEFLEKLPGRFNKILDLAASNNLRMQIDTIDEAVLVDAAQKVANRITLGLVLASLIMGASLLMRVPTTFHLFGYPGLAIICFILAASAGFGLVVQIAIYDQKPKKFAD